MPLDLTRVRQHLKDLDFETLFIEELGWDRHPQSLGVMVDGEAFTLSAVAQKRGMVAFLCPCSSDFSRSYPTRRKIERQVAKSVHEHLIIYTDAAQTTQIWQWVKREAGKPTACREHTYHRNQPGDALVQKLRAIAFSLEDEEQLTIVHVARGARAAFDMDRITKKFYDRFKSEHATFLEFIKGIPDEERERWYASVMLNRLMFIYFVQKKGFLDGDTDYLKTKLTQSRKERKDDFYRGFLCRLFFEGFATKGDERPPETKRLLGKVPYLNGGIFMPHPIEEQHGDAIQIEDKAFEKLFDFFDQYHWHLDERPLRADNEINPDVLGYIFEKYINQKQMGAYYTKEDITEYISKNTVIPFLFDAARQKCKVAFEGETSIWQLLQADPDRYIYEPVRRGVINEQVEVIPESALPDFVQTGMHDPKARMFDKRYNLGEADLQDSEGNKLTLPTETWREYVERRKRCLQLRSEIANPQSEMTVNDLITLNLDLRQFAQDVIENCEGPDLLNAFWQAIQQVTVLDPTCGSGAFLFAALNILEPLYQACLDRMESFIEEWGEQERMKDDGGRMKKDRTSADSSFIPHPSSFRRHPNYHKAFTAVLARMAKHPNQRYFILKSIIVNNLFGVDIMEEAVEICKLRLFLKLVAQIERVEDIEPLPDIDFNIRAGNTLVGYATYDDVKRAVGSRFDFDDAMPRIEEKAQEVDRLFALFRQQQTELGGEVTPADKQALRDKLKELEDELNRYLATEYGVEVPSPSSSKSKSSSFIPHPSAFAKWLHSHKPFHWFIEFHSIMRSGGFDVIIGNPPYVEYGKVRQEYIVKSYQTESCGNLYAFIVERNEALLKKRGWTGMIVPHSAICTDRMAPFMELLDRSTGCWVSTYYIRPAKLFVGVDQRLAIYVKAASDLKGRYCTRYHRWNEESRDALFSQVEYADIESMQSENSWPKIGKAVEDQLWQRTRPLRPLGEFLSGRAHLYFHNSPRYWIRAMTFKPYFWNEREGEQLSTQVKLLSSGSKVDAEAVTAVLNSSLFYWWFVILSDSRHLNMREIDRFPVALAEISDDLKEKLGALTAKLMADYRQHAVRKETEYQATGQVIYDEFYPRYSKPILDQIDCVLARHYGFTDEEVDFIINYDIKYRMGREAGNEEDAAV